MNKLNVNNIFTEYNDVVMLKDLKKMLGISREYAHHLINNNKIKSIKSGRMILIPKQSIIDYLNENEDCLC